MNRTAKLAPAILMVAALMVGCASENPKTSTAEDRSARLDRIARAQQYEQANRPTAQQQRPVQDTRAARSADSGSDGR